MKQLSGKEFCSILEKKGWKRERIKGSHHIYGKNDQKIKLSVPVHKNKALKKGLLTYFMKIAHLSEKDL
ncbi:MAG: hypothetical protein A2Y62_21530 [Candidatus Fischerbacteria bacterium RBG_13_37_8]|uniref:Addiction module toxin, HicA family n=1 Tax=Candidatus Fischerbacteria bacterium RBG_13_37_8 TaxID=1817863 RepID=A0A1F5VX03_9BACT|nr:MAG: hypothetical protein A2Y62_21530 [Candidatus Fischerbacteria bacterium RBG_13_37_8]